MFKYALLAGALTIAVPALAQSTTTSPQTAPAGAPVAADPSMAQTAPAQADPSTAQTAQTAQPATADQVAQVINAEFPTYDKNGDGKLSTTEFGAWMVALKSKTDPTTNASAAETKTWVNAAFAQADTDKNKSLTKAEVTSFLSKG